MNAPCFGRYVPVLLGLLLAGSVRADVRGAVSAQADLSVYAPQAPAPGLLFSDNDVFVAPRLSVFADLMSGDRATLHGLLNADRGFDPALKTDGDVRLDEYFLQAELLGDERLSVRVGKFASSFGNWIPRRLATDNAFVTAPMLYENVLTITDSVAPPTVNGFAARRDLKDNKAGWVPIIWGPSYTTGASIATRGDTFDFVVEVKNAALSSRPSTWDAVNEGFDLPPTVTGRLGWRAAPEWSLGSSFSCGPYMRNDAKASLPNDANVDDYGQTTLGLDAAYAHHRLQVWSELVGARFEVPRVGDVEVLSGYIEIRYKLTAQTWLASRWNQSWFNDVPGQHLTWDREMRRFDFAFGYRYNEHVQAKLQYSIGDQAGNDTNGQRVVALQASIWL